MLKFVIRRLIYMVPTLIGITIVTFVLFNIVGGNPAATIAGKYANAERIREIEQALGLNEPLYIQYFTFVKQVVTFNFGESWSTNQPITEMISAGIIPSLSLTGPAFLVVLIISISLSLILAHYRGGNFDRIVLVGCLAAMSVSSLVYILYMQYWLAYKAGLFPISGWDSSLTGRWSFVALPMIIFIAFSMGGNVLFYRTVFLDEIESDYIRTAKAKGLGTSKILFKHVLRNAMIPIITIIALEMPLLILGSLLLESFFGIPGLGGIIYSAIQNADFPVIKAMTVIGAILYMLFQFVSDILYAWADPKIQLR